MHANKVQDIYKDLLVSFMLLQEFIDEQGNSTVAWN